MSSSDDDEDLDLDIIASVTKELRGSSRPQQPPKPVDDAPYVPAAEDSSDEGYDDDLDEKPSRVPARSSYSQPNYSQSQPSQVPLPAAAKPSPNVVYSETESESEEEVVKEVVRTRKHENGNGERIVMTDDEDDDFLQKQKQAKARGQKRKRATASRATTRKTAKTVRDAAPRRAKAAAKERNVLSWRTVSDGVEEEDRKEGKDVDLPDYLIERKKKYDRAIKAWEATEEESKLFRYPPELDDDTRGNDLSRLETRPHFAHLTSPPAPCAPYKDIPLPGGGIIPCSQAAYLKPYQVDGVKFLYDNFVLQRGCILGDDMGLGKTVQVICFLSAIFGKFGDERDRRTLRRWKRHEEVHGKTWYPKVLIVCPGTLIKNWQSEFEAWGWWSIEVYHGKDKEEALHAARTRNLEVMITTYDTYKKPEAMELINLIEWDAVIADECHKIKEKKAGVTIAMNSINALCRIGLTGTAIQNDYKELWTLLNWCRPGAVGDISSWKRQVSEPLKRGQAHGATYYELGSSRVIAKDLRDNLLPRMFLRRMKTLIADQLPKKTDRVVFCPLTMLQKTCYENFLESPMVELCKYSAEECECGSGEKRGKCCFIEDESGTTWKQLVFPCITWLQKLSNHLMNWVPQNNESNEMRAKKMQVLEWGLGESEAQRLKNREQLVNYKDNSLCGKWIVLQKLLRHWHQAGDKVLVFSYSLEVLKVLKVLLIHTEYNICSLDGSMPLQDRQDEVDRFNADPDQFVFLISTKAGGVGLNITAANKVVIFDPNWNPSYDLQAQDRAYRIGQTRDVEVFRLISLGTIEEVTYARQIYKQQQMNIGYNASEERRYFKGVQGDLKNRGELFGLKNLLSYQDSTMLQDIVNKTNVAEAKLGFAIGDLNPEDDDLSGGDDDGELGGALSQLADIAIKGGKVKNKRKRNPIAAILAEAGVSYTHDNSEVIGTSKVEQQISRRAVESKKDKNMADVRAFQSSQPGEEGGEDWIYGPPEDVRLRHFRDIALAEGYADVREFAMEVESWGWARMRRVLDKYYRALREGVQVVKESQSGVKMESQTPES